MHRVPGVAILLIVSLTAALRAQSTSVSLTGRVTDPTKAVIVAAKVSAIHASTNFRYETTTNSSGEYFLAHLPPGALLASSLGSGGANGGFNPLFQIGEPRSIQLALKLQF